MLAEAITLIYAPSAARTPADVQRYASTDKLGGAYSRTVMLLVTSDEVRPRWSVTVTVIGSEPDPDITVVAGDAVNCLPSKDIE